MTEPIILDQIDEFEAAFTEVIGIYLDTIMGFELAEKMVEKAQRQFGPEAGMTVAQLDNAPFRHTTPAPEFREIHGETRGEFKARMSKGGKNQRFAANVCIAMIYAYWEDHYRRVIAEVSGTAKNDIISDIMGEIRLLRNSIIHHRGVALPGIENCKLIRKFKEGDTIQLTREDIIYIHDAMKADLVGYRKSLYKAD